MSRTKKDSKKDNYNSRMRLGKKLKEEAKEHKKTLKDETNPKVFKRLSANEWDIT